MSICLNDFLPHSLSTSQVKCWALFISVPYPMPVIWTVYRLLTLFMFRQIIFFQHLFWEFLHALVIKSNGNHLRNKTSSSQLKTEELRGSEFGKGALSETSEQEASHAEGHEMGQAMPILALQRWQVM